MADGRDNFSKGVSNLRTSVSVVFFVELGEFLQANTIKAFSQELSHAYVDDDIHNDDDDEISSIFHF